MSHRTESVECVVRYSNGTHITNRVQGQQASSTAGYLDAARALGRKLYGDRFEHAVQLEANTQQGWVRIRITARRAEG